MKKQITLDHVERLSRGKRSGANVGSRAVGHHLRPHERTQFERALGAGYLEITQKDRANLWHIWEKACAAQQWVFLVLIKDTAANSGTLYRDNQQTATKTLADAKELARELAAANLLTN